MILSRLAPLIAAILALIGWGVWATAFQAANRETAQHNARVLLLPASHRARTVVVLPCEVGVVSQFTAYKKLSPASLSAARADVFQVPAGARRAVVVPGCLSVQTGTGGTGNVGSGEGGHSALLPGQGRTAVTQDPVTAWIAPSARATGVRPTAWITLPRGRTVRTILVPRCPAQNNGSGGGGTRTDRVALQGATAIAPPCYTGGA